MRTDYGLSFVDAEKPAIAGGQLVLGEAPLPAASLQLFRNGMLQASGADFILAGQVAVPTPPPAAGDVWLAFYRCGGPS